jgi:hypothetical protein
MTRLPLDFPPLVATAEARVRADWPIEEQTRARLGHSVRGDTIDDYGAEVRAFVIGCEIDRLRDITRPASRDAWLRWLAHELGVPVPAVGLPQWYRSSNEAVVSWWLGQRILFVFGAASDPAAYGNEESWVIRCPALDNPDADDAPIRALKLAVETVCQRKEKP